MNSSNSQMICVNVLYTHVGTAYVQEQNILMDGSDVKHVARRVQMD